MTRNARDNRRQKLYDAEREAFKGRECDELKDLSVKDCQEFVDKVMRSRWWGSNVRDRDPIIVGDGRGHRNAMAYAPTWTRPAGIALPLWARKPSVILHEIAHHAADRIYGTDGVAAHGPEFAKTYLALVQRFIGKEDADLLRASYKKHRVKYRVR